MKLGLYRPEWCPYGEQCANLLMYYDGEKLIDRMCVGRMSEPVEGWTERNKELSRPPAIETHRLCLPCVEPEPGTSKQLLMTQIVLNVYDLDFFRGLIARLEVDMQRENGDCLEGCGRLAVKDQRCPDCALGVTVK